MKKIISFIGATTSYLTFLPQAFAQSDEINTDLNPCPEGTQFDALCNITNFGNVIGFVITVAFILAVLIALGFLIWGGIKWITSGGDKAGVEGARNTIIAAIIGLIIVFLSFFILNLVLGFFKINLFNLELPTFPTT